MRLRQLTQMATHMAEQQENMVKEVDSMIKEAGCDVEPLTKDDLDYDGGTSEEGTSSEDAGIPAGAAGALDVLDVLNRPSTSSSSDQHDDPLHPAEPASEEVPGELEAMASTSSLSPKRRDISYALVPIEGIDDGRREAVTGALQARLERRKLGYSTSGRPASRPASRHTSRLPSRANEQTLTPLMLYESLTYGNLAPLPFSSTFAASVAPSKARLQPLDPSYWADYDDLGPSISQQHSPRMSSSPEPHYASPPGPPHHHGWALGPLPPREGSPAPRRRGGTPKSRPGSRQQPRNFRELEQQEAEEATTAAPGQPTSAPPHLHGRPEAAAADNAEPFDHLQSSSSKEEQKRTKEKERKKGKFARKLNKAVCCLVMDGMLDALEASEAPFAVVTAKFGSDFCPDEGSTPEQLQHQKLQQLQNDERAEQRLQMCNEILTDELTEQGILSLARGETPVDSSAEVSPTGPHHKWGVPPSGAGDVLPGSVPESPRDELGRSQSSKGPPHQRRDRMPSLAEATAKSRMLGMDGDALADPGRPATAPVISRPRQ